MTQAGRYWEYIHPILGRYGGSSVLDEKVLKERYWTELALLHLLVTLVERGLAWHGIDAAFPFWTSRFEDQLYAWYEPTPRLDEEMRNWAERQVEDNKLLQAFSMVVGRAFPEKETRRALGEFYTPLPIAQHLTDSLQIEANWVAMRIKIVDPASGSGSLLGAIERCLIGAALANNISVHQTLQQLSDALHGFDVQPCAVLLTRLWLMLGILPILDGSDDAITIPSFPNVRLLDPLAEPDPYWDPSGQFDYVIANPPFSKLARNRVAFLDRYGDIIYGQPNLYQLFLWWAVRAVKPGGRIAFLMPQSFRSGLYFHKLRQQLASNCDLQAVTLFTSRIGIFNGVDSPLMTITLQKRPSPLPKASRNTVAVRVSPDGNDLAGLESLTVAREKVLRAHSYGPIWCISDQRIDYDLLEKVYAGATQLMDLADRFDVRNGGFVWNQHKSVLQPEARADAVPLLSAPSVSPFQFNFPIESLVKKKRQFALVTPQVVELLRTGSSILVKRTTPKKRGRRIMAALIPEEFISDSPAFFVENHLNIIEALCDDDLALLNGLVGWLNSRLLNFVFHVMNGTSHISIFELNLLPLPISWLPQLANDVDELSQMHGTEGSTLWSALDRRIYDFYDLTDAERKRVDILIP